MEVDNTQGAEHRASQRVAEKIGMQRISEFTRYGHQYWKYALERDTAKGQ
jgi:RimJ/RimL family protein N-acetyltransferase